MDGDFVFHGKTVHQIEVPLSDEAQAFDVSLREYLRRGYAADAADGRTTSRAIGFVMTVYRKLAASSVAAIYGALLRRQARLRGGEERLRDHREDDRDQGEQEEQAILETTSTPFFEDEEEILQDLIDEASTLTNRFRQP